MLSDFKSQFCNSGSVYTLQIGPKMIPQILTYNAATLRGGHFGDLGFFSTTLPLWGLGRWKDTPPHTPGHCFPKRNLSCSLSSLNYTSSSPSQVAYPWARSPAIPDDTQLEPSLLKARSVCYTSQAFGFVCHRTNSSPYVRNRIQLHAGSPSLLIPGGVALSWEPVEVQGEDWAAESTEAGVDGTP